MKTLLMKVLVKESIDDHSDSLLPGPYKCCSSRSAQIVWFTLHFDITIYLIVTKLKVRVQAVKPETYFQ